MGYLCRKTSSCAAARTNRAIWSELFQASTVTSRKFGSGNVVMSGGRM